MGPAMTELVGTGWPANPRLRTTKAVIDTPGVAPLRVAGLVLTST